MVSGRSIGSKLGQKFGQRITDVRSVAQTVAQVAKSQLNQVITDLQHSDRVKESQEILQRIGQGVLDRAEAIRAQIASTPLSPSWLKEVHVAGARRVDGHEGRWRSDAHPNGHAHADSAADHHGHSSGIHKPGFDEAPATATSVTESTVSEAAAEMQSAPMRVILEDEKASEQLGFAAMREIEEFTDEAGTIVETSDLPKRKARGKSEKSTQTSKAKKTDSGKTSGTKSRSSKSTKKS